MATTDFDVIIGGTKAKVVRGEDGGYRRRTLRREVEQQLLSQSETPAMVSRPDQRQLYQSSWAGGSTWWKPLLGAQEANSYFQANGFDLWSEPGKVVPANKVELTNNNDLHDNCVMATDESGDVYAIGSTNNVGSPFLDVYKWTPGSDDFVQETGYHSGVPDGEEPVDMVYDPNDNYFYVLVGDGLEVTRFNPATSADDDAWMAHSGLGNHASIGLHRQGLVTYDGKVNLIDKTGPSFEAKFNDGMGADLLQEIDTSGTNPIIRGIDNMVVTPEGIYYAKNTMSHGGVVSWIFRVERDAAGNWIGNPIATLPVGTVVLGVTYHLGHVMLLASPDWRTIVENDTQDAEIQLLSVDSQSGISVLGSILGGRDELDETPYAFLGSSGSYLYMGGHRRLWVFDGGRGGLHSFLKFPAVTDDGAWSAMAHVTDSDGDPALVFLGNSSTITRVARTKLTQVNDPATVTNFGDWEGDHVLTSNYFDGGLPMEVKELTHIEILHEQLDTGDGTNSNQEWTIQVSADDGSFTDALVNSAADSDHGEADLSGTTGRIFQYRLIYQTKNTLRKALRALKVAFTTGEMITEWDLTLDGDELLNVDNDVQDEQEFYDALVTLAGTSTITTFVDNMQEQEQETDSATTVNVKVQAVEINKQKPGESVIRVVLREAS